MPRFAANLTLMFTEQPFPARFAAAARAGFAAVEFLFPYDDPPGTVAAWLRDAGLRNVLFNLPPGDWAGGERGLAALPGREAEFRDSVAQAIDYALALGTPQLHALAGRLPDAADEACRAAYRETYVANLRYAARELARHDRMLLIEPINLRDMPGYFLNRQDVAHAVCAAVGAPNLKVQMDFYHAQIVEGDLATTLRKFIGNIGHVQIAGVPDRHEPDVGEVDYAYLFRLLDEIGYAGWVGCEYRPAGRTEAGLGWLQRLAGIPAGGAVAGRACESRPDGDGS